MSSKVLLVESDPALSTTWRQALESRGFTVEALTDAARCVEQVRQERPDAVVLAVELSGGQNGYLLCGRLKKDDALKHIPIVIVGNPEGFAPHRKLKARADEYVAKPVDPTLLAERVARVLGAPQGPGPDTGVPSPAVAERPSLTPPERRGPSALWLLIALAAVAGGAWMLYRGLTREAPLPASNVQP